MKNEISKSLASFGMTILLFSICMPNMTVPLVIIIFMLATIALFFEEISERGFFATVFSTVVYFVMLNSLLAAYYIVLMLIGVFEF